MFWRESDGVFGKKVENATAVLWEALMIAERRLKRSRTP